MKRKYDQSGKADATTEKIMETYTELPPNEQQVIDELVKALRINFRARGGSGIGRLGGIELFGKLGRWMVKHEFRGTVGNVQPHSENGGDVGTKSTKDTRTRS
jgi:hypothetical protein